MILSEFSILHSDIFRNRSSNELIHTIPKEKTQYSHLAKPLFDNFHMLKRDISSIVLDGIKNDLNEFTII